jgi:formylglycine-generating enzyme required for sulfatase activity
LDGGVRTAPTGSYKPNDYGLFDMSGNVTEWTLSAFDEQSYKFVNALNPSYTYSATEGEAISMKRKVLRGGSWKDIAYFIQCGARTFEYQDTSKSYIGFRCVRSYLGK